MDAVRDPAVRPSGREPVRSSPSRSVGGQDAAGVQARLKVWIDQDLCTGDGLCTDHAPSVFTLLEDGIAYVVEDGQVLHDPGGPSQLAAVAPAQEENVIHAAAECPGECIFIELEEVAALEA